MISFGNEEKLERLYFDSDEPPYERRQQLIDNLLDSFRKAKLDLLFWHLATRRNGGGDSLEKKEICLQSLDSLIKTCNMVVKEIKSCKKGSKK